MVFCPRRVTLLNIALGTIVLVLVAVDTTVQRVALTRAGSVVPAWIGGGATANLSQGPTFGLAVVHCRETNMTWLEEIPSSWRLAVYETCGRSVSDRGSVPFQNAGSEECSAYFEYMIQNYDDLPDISVFLQSDGLTGYGRVKTPFGEEGQKFGGHTPFATMDALINTTQLKIRDEGRQFVNYGWPIQFGENDLYNNNTYTRHYLGELWTEMGRLNETRIRTRPGACFAVHRDRILAHPRSLYKSLQKKILQENPSEARRRCCALENSWHALMGEPAILPVESSIDALYVKH